MLANKCESMFAGAPPSFFNKDVTGKSETFKALRATDLLSNGYLATEGLQDVEVKEGRNIERFLLQEGDVVLLARGSSMRCCIVTQEAAKERLLATANFIVLRLKQEHRSEFLVAYFNSPLGKQALGHNDVSVSTNVMKSLSLSGLKKLEVPFPALEVQKKIAELFHVHVAAQQAALALIEEQKKAVDVKILDLMGAI